MLSCGFPLIAASEQRPTVDEKGQEKVDVANQEWIHAT